VKSNPEIEKFSNSLGINTKLKFKDISNLGDIESAIKIAVKVGLINNNEYFYPNRHITR